MLLLGCSGYFLGCCWLLDGCYAVVVVFWVVSRVLLCCLLGGF